MPTTILQYLTRPNPTVTSYAITGGLTINDEWNTIEGILPWEDFTYDILCAKFETELRKRISLWDPNDLIEKSRFNEMVGEDSVTAFVTVNSILAVNAALWEIENGLHVGPGSKSVKPVGLGSPDWGGYRASPINRLNFCPGDIKCSTKWSSDGLFEAKWDMYIEERELLDKALPLEQVQHYCTHLGTRYGWVLTDKELVVIRVTNSVDDDPTSPRQTRASRIGIGARRETHERVVSNTSNMSSAFSAMSVDHSAYTGHTGSSSGNNPAPLEVVCIPMSASATAKGQLTVNLGLFFLVLLAREDSAISSSYPSLGPEK